jgi:tetratricopeptide (TPR) repeat protein
MGGADSEAYRLLGTILQAEDRGGAAVASFEEAVRLDPRSAKALKNLAVALAEEGRLSAAIDASRSALRVRPGYFSALYLLAQLKEFSAGDPDLVVLEALARDEDALEERDLVRLCFTLAKAYEDVGDYERSFGYMRRANALKRKTFEYDVAGDVRSLRQIAAAFPGELFDRFAGAGSGSELPILIVGMPRSGTSLVEQILASHPAVHGGGELGHLRELVGAVSLLNEAGLGFPEGVARLRFDDFDRLGHGYVGRLQQIAPEAQRVTDKNNWNFRRIGVARLIVPRARVIHCLREPLDTCVSCYSLLGEVEFACDLGELGRYYRAYAQLMAHWRSVLPSDWMLEVRYEDLVEDVERETRRIVSYCGLDWDDSCLSFYATERTVRTASFAQVRRPVYDHSIGRWRPYEPYLGPLVAGLDGDER